MPAAASPIPYFADYAAVIDHYDRFLRLGLDGREKADLQECLKSL